MSKDKPDLSVLAAVDRDLKVLGEREPGLELTALAASARELARQLDDPGNSATSKSMCAKSLTEVLERLEGLAPPKSERDFLDKFRDRRGAAAKN